MIGGDVGGSLLGIKGLRFAAEDERAEDGDTLGVEEVSQARSSGITKEVTSISLTLTRLLPVADGMFAVLSNELGD